MILSMALLLEKTHGLLATSRVANVPSVICNVWLGIAIALVHRHEEMSGQTWKWASGLALAGVLLYVGGNFLNDWMDREWDARHRPERALPRRLFSVRLYGMLALGLMAGGSLLAWTIHFHSGLVACSIFLAISIYTFFHKRTVWAVIPMGLCRALLPMMGFFAFHPYVDAVLPAAAGLFFYIMGLTLKARYESMSEPPAWVGRVARWLLLATPLLVAWGNRGLFLPNHLILAGVVPYLCLTSFTLRYRLKPISRLVSNLLAGIPLVDWVALLPIALAVSPASLLEANAFSLTCLLLPPLAFISAKLLQRLAPAT
jgi:UbiA prenyltransferase family